MAKLLTYAVAAKNAKLDALTAYIAGGAKLRIYSGTRPATPAAAITGTLLVELVCATPFAPASSAGVLTAGTIANGTAVATGTATHARLFKADGTTVVLDLNVGTGDFDINIDNTSITSGQTVAISSMTITEG